MNPTHKNHGEEKCNRPDTDDADNSFCNCTEQAGDTGAEYPTVEKNNAELHDTEGWWLEKEEYPFDLSQILLGPGVAFKVLLIS